ncbi:MAG: AmmeMemoRadiSam system protein B, partial [Candidatus Promineifilaceae bacterium]|nr:AmmeMemoRadiSam system protein B [Candidatus Promineifilaceae bacterium]
AYRSLPHRPPALAGISYPAEREALTAQLDLYAPQVGSNGAGPWRGRALVSPHIDYERGGAVYGRVWRHAQVAVAEADLVLIFGTDHNADAGAITLTEQPYATPFGKLPADREVVQKLAAAIGPEEAFRLELNHREEHSVELSAVWLHYLYQEIDLPPAPMVPILCGSFQHFIEEGRHPEHDARFSAFLEALCAATEGRKVLAVASVDLGHVGPHFGDPLPMTLSRRQRLKASDRRLIDAIKRGDHSRFYREIATVNNSNRICGFSSLYLMLRYLDAASPASLRGREVAYEQCAADMDEASFVSICGLLLE